MARADDPRARWATMATRWGGRPRRRGECRVHGGAGRRDRRIARHALDWSRLFQGRRGGGFPSPWRSLRPGHERCQTSLNVTGTEDISHRLTPPRRPFTVPGMQTPDQQFNSRASGAIAHLRGREHALARFGWAARRAEWIALACLHGGVFTRAQGTAFPGCHHEKVRRAVRKPRRAGDGRRGEPVRTRRFRPRVPDPQASDLPDAGAGDFCRGA